MFYGELQKQRGGENKKKLKRDKVFHLHLERPWNLKQQFDVWQMYPALKSANPANCNTDFVGKLPLAHVFDTPVVSDLFADQERFIGSFSLHFIHVLRSKV